MDQATASNAQAILDGWLPTDRLVWYAAHWHMYDGSATIADKIVVGSGGPAAALAYFKSLDEDYAREQAAEALAGGGWDMHKINYKLS